MPKTGQIEGTGSSCRWQTGSIGGGGRSCLTTCWTWMWGGLRTPMGAADNLPQLILGTDYIHFKIVIFVSKMLISNMQLSWVQIICISKHNDVNDIFVSRTLNIKKDTEILSALCFFPTKGEGIFRTWVWTAAICNSRIWQSPQVWCCCRVFPGGPPPLSRPMCTDFITFRKKVRELDRRLGSVLTAAFEEGIVHRKLLVCPR